MMVGTTAAQKISLVSGLVMSAQVLCPHCGKSIKLRDRSLLGKKGKCPACAKSFLLQEQTAPEPEEEEVIPLQLADDESASEEPAVGTGAQWVPDDPTAAPATAQQFPVTYVPVQTPQGIVLAPVVNGQVAGYQMAPMPQQPQQPSPFAAVQHGSPAATAAPPAAPSPFDFDLGAVDASSATGGTATTSSARTARSPRKARNNQNLWIGGGVAIAVLAMAAFLLSRPGAPAPGPQVATAPASETGPAVVPEIPSPPGAYSREALTSDPRLVAEFKPTKGEPIPLDMLTGSNNILIHLHPDRIWGSERAAQELKASLTEDVYGWLETTIKKVTHRSPDQIEELLIGISIVSKVEPPQISTVFRLKTPEKRSALVLEFNGEEVSATGKPFVTSKDGFAYHVKDDQTIAISPANYGIDLSDAAEKPLDCVTNGIQQLLRASDRDRSVSVFMDVTDVLTYSDQLFEPSATKAMTKVLEWFGPDAETVSWSLNLGSTFHSEIRVRPKGSHSTGGKISTPDSLREDYVRRLPATVEQDLVNASRMMRPTRSGFRQIIGRFPAMVEAFRQATIIQPSQTFLTMTTVLPAKAGPNLALGTVLTWDESTRTNFSGSDPTMTVADAGPSLPTTVMGRLKQVFEIEFSRKPLQEAFTFIGEEAQVTFVIDGDALKMAGYTKNMPQTFKLGKTPGTKGLYTILTWPMQEKMCLVVDDAKMEAHITTTAAAESQGLKIVPVDSLK